MPSNAPIKLVHESDVFGGGGGGRNDTALVRVFLLCVGRAQPAAMGRGGEPQALSRISVLGVSQEREEVERRHWEQCSGAVRQVGKSRVRENKSRKLF